MKIGLISINAHTKVLNFASPLHTYAFQQFLMLHGIESTIIDYKPNYYGQFNPRYPYFYYRKHPMDDKKKQKALEHKWLKLFFARRTRFDKFQKFIDQHYITTDKCYNHKLLDEEDLGMDCYICVTDVIWKCNKSAKFDRGFFLACESMKGKHKIAYSASRGPSQYDEKYEKIFLDYIEPFDYISVREKSFLDYIQSITKKPVTQVLDPVLLHEKEFYEPIIQRPKKKKRGYVLIYVVMEKPGPLIKLAVNFAQKHNLDVIELSENLEDANIPEGTHHKIVYNIGVEEWLGYMDSATYIFTNSFHAACFSILFHKQIFVGKRNGDKITSLLGLFGLEHRTIQECFQGKKCVADKIDYAPVDEKRRALKEKSTEFILHAIHDVEQRFEAEQKKSSEASIEIKK